MTEPITCIQPDQVNDADYLAALNQDMRPEFERHLAQCEFCRNELQVYRAQDNKLRRQFEFISSPDRTLCPEAQRVGEYVVGLLSPLESAKLRQHLAQCPWCSTEADQLRQWFAEPDNLLVEPSRRPPDRLAGERSGFDRLRRVVATLLRPDNGSPLYTHAGVRGEVEGGSLTFQAEDITVILTVQPEGPRSKTLNITGLVQAQDLAPDALVGKKVHLLYEGKEFATDALDDTGNFFFEEVQPPQPFELDIILGDKIISVPDLRLG